MKPNNNLLSHDTLISNLSSIYRLIPTSFASRRISIHQIMQIALQPAVFSSNTTMRVCSRGTCSTCSSTTFSLSSGVLISWSPWASALLLGHFLPTTGRFPNRTIYPHSPCLRASFAPSGRLLHCHEFNICNNVHSFFYYFVQNLFFSPWKVWTEWLSHHLMALMVQYTSTCRMKRIV